MRTFRGVLAIAIMVMPCVASAQQRQDLAPDQKAFIAYHYCMLQAGMDASKTPATEDQIFDLAFEACATTRAQAAQIGRQVPALLTALDEADAEKRSNFPDWVRGVRERRAQFEAQLPTAVTH